MAYVQDGQERVLKSYWAVPASVIEDEKQMCEWDRAAHGAPSVSVACGQLCEFEHGEIAAHLSILSLLW
ncbi:hypothetical protein C5N93_15735 [Pandoraea sp. LA3]|nr:hypothetical protein [Pandoraea sp. LA3]